MMETVWCSVCHLREVFKATENGAFQRLCVNEHGLRLYSEVSAMKMPASAWPLPSSAGLAHPLLNSLSISQPHSRPLASQPAANDAAGFLSCQPPGGAGFEGGGSRRCARPAEKTRGLR